MNLYEINREIEDILECSIDMETGEISDEAIERLNELQLERDAKVENVALWHKNLMAESKAIADEIKALQERKKALDRKMEWQENYLNYALDGHKFESPKVMVSYRRSTAVEIDDVEKFIEENKFNTVLVNEKVEWTPNKTAIKNLLKEGKEVNGARLVDRQNLQIK